MGQGNSLSMRSFEFSLLRLLNGLGIFNNQKGREGGRSTVEVNGELERSASEVDSRSGRKLVVCSKVQGLLMSVAYLGIRVDLG